MKNLKEILSLKSAYISFVSVSCFALVYHVLILTQVVSYANAWGGRLPSLQAMYIFETFSFISQLLFIGFAYARYRSLGGKKAQRALSIIFYIIAFMLLLNTVGNFLSTSFFEAALFSPLTLLMSIVAFRLARD